MEKRVGSSAVGAAAVVAVIICIISAVQCAPTAIDVKDMHSAMAFLNSTGMMGSGRPNPYMASLTHQNSQQNAIRNFQATFNLDVSGHLDKPTMDLMNTPHCGNKFFPEKADFTLYGGVWEKEVIFWGVSVYPTSGATTLTHSEIVSELTRAFKIWSDVTPLRFIQRTNSQVDIDIKFVSGHHNDNNPFEPGSKILAHAFSPGRNTGGDTHFNDVKTFTIGIDQGSNLFLVAAHEFGHSLGLGHSTVQGALMYPFYSYTPDFTMHNDDRMGIQTLYGAKTGPELPNPDPATPDPPATMSPRPPTTDPNSDTICNFNKMDTITRTADGTTYVFRGSSYYELSTYDGVVDMGDISTDWDKLPSDLDAALFWEKTQFFSHRACRGKCLGITLFFKNTDVYTYHNKIQISRRSIVDAFPGLPYPIDAALSQGWNSHTYFFKGNKYYQAEEGGQFSRINSTYLAPTHGAPRDTADEWWKDPQPVSIPPTVDAIFQWSNGYTYIFSGTQYWEYDTSGVKLQRSSFEQYPRSTTEWWFGCPTTSG